MLKNISIIAFLLTGYCLCCYSQAPNINYPAFSTYVAGDTIRLNPTHTGLLPITYTVSPSLPPEFKLDVNTGIIDGTHIGVLPATNYIITATNSNGIGICNISIAVKPKLSPPNITYNVSNPLTAGKPIAPLVPINSGGVATYSATALPDGLSIAPATGIISGTPGSASPSKSYTITATNSAGINNYNLSIGIVLPPPPLISYNLASTFQVNVPIAPLVPIQADATAVYSATGLPAGLTIDPKTGIITGMPTSINPVNNVTVTATNLTGSSTYNFNMAISPPAEYAFWMELGSNFDLLDFKTFKPNNLYAGVLAFVKDRATLKMPFRKAPFPVSFTGGVYESQSSSTAATSDSGLIYRDGSTYLQTKKGYPYYRDIGSVSSNTTVKSVGLFFSPHFLLTSVQSKDPGFHLYFSFYVEMLWQHVNTSFDYSKTQRDTVMYESNINNIYQHNYKENSVDLDYRSHYLGAGFPIYIKEDGYTFYLNPVLGLTSQKFAFLQGNLSPQAVDLRDYKTSPTPMDQNPLAGFATPKSSWNYFYITQFRLTSEQYNVSFTGEVRGFFLRQSQPIISLSISKKFDVGKLIGDLLGK